MLRINCHSAFKHYEMFHGSCGSDSNYGSIFNTTYNINCGGHGGGFWSGFGAGLGNAFGNIFSGMLGSGMGNFGMGNFGLGGFGGFGMGGLTMPWFNSMGNWGFGGGNINSTSGNNGSNTSSVLVDKDNAIYNRFEDEVNKLIDKADPKAAKKLYDKIKAKQEKPEDSINEGMNKGAYSHLIAKLEEKYPELKSGNEKPSNASTGTSGDNKPTASTQNNTEAATTTSTGASATSNEPAGTTGTPTAGQAGDDKTSQIDNANDLNSLLQVKYKDLDDVGKQAYLNKAIDLAKDNNTTPEQLRNALAGMPREVRVKVKESFYAEGYSNIKPDKLNAEMLKNLKDIIDTSEIPDFENITVGTPKQDNGSWMIPIQTKGGTKINYVQVSVNPEDGEIIFHGKKATQKYALQKDNKGKLHLMQYKYHDGYNKPDVTKNKK